MMAETSSTHNNPWWDDGHSLGSARNLLSLAERTGCAAHISTYEPDAHSEIPADDSEGRFPSIRLISQLKNISHSTKKLNKIELELQCRLHDKETRDITHVSTQEKRLESLNAVNSHLQAVVTNKDQLRKRLMQPYMGDFIRIEASYKRFASELIPQIIPVLSELSSHLDEIQWASKVNYSEGELDTLLSDISRLLASMQISVGTMYKSRSVLQQLSSTMNNTGRR